MMLYTFIKDTGGDVKRIGADCDVPEKLQEVTMEYSKDGWVLATAKGVVPTEEETEDKPMEGVV
jgi:hypothetical protein